MPGSQAPTNLIALFWDDLNLSTSGRVHAATDPIAGMFTLQFQSAPIKGAGGTTVTCQLVLKTTGEILMQYQAIGVSNAGTAGVQDAPATLGPQVAHNQSYLQSGLAVCLSPIPWLESAVNAGLVPGSNVELVNLTFNPASVPAGIYTTCSSVEVAYITDHAEAAVNLVEDAAQWSKVRAMKRDPAGDRLPRLRHVVTMRDATPIEHSLL